MISILKKLAVATLVIGTAFAALPSSPAEAAPVAVTATQDSFVQPVQYYRYGYRPYYGRRFYGGYHGRPYGYGPRFYGPRFYGPRVYGPRFYGRGYRYGYR